nr:hypothetical protein [bacterium]
MELFIIQAPHANALYRVEERRLLAAEWAVASRGLEGAEMGNWIQDKHIAGFVVACKPGDEEAIARAAALSGAMAVFEKRPDGSLMPLCGPEPTPYDAMAGILKYKGKTNETFTRTLIRMAVFSGDYAAGWRGGLTVLDPMCGRGTALFCALAMGYHAVGIEAERTHVSELTAFTNRYLQQGRIRHQKSRTSATLKGREAGKVDTYLLGDGKRLSVALGDTAAAPAFYGKQPADALVCDLPYGVQHRQTATAGGGLKLLERAIEGWRGALKPGAAAAVSFNTYTLPTRQVRAAFEKAGWQVAQGGVYDTMEHWVEQAVRRDIVIARAPGAPQKGRV